MPIDALTDEPSSYLLEQRLRYTYAEPARRLRQRLVVVPREQHGGQKRVDHGITMSGSTGVIASKRDSFGNERIDVRVEAVDEWIEFATWAVVEFGAPRGITPLTRASSNDRRLLDYTPLTQPDDRLIDQARDLVASGGSDIDLAERACAWAHESLDYEWGVTNVHTGASEALAGGRGVCQDYTHVMLALCRAAGLPARYVSGHLVGEGGSHAWAEVVVRDDSTAGADRKVAIAFDPTHDRRAERGYLTVAVGRDYADVAPTSGSFEGTCPGVLSAHKRLSPATALPSRATG